MIGVIMCDVKTDFVPIAEAALLLGTTEALVLTMLKSNELQGKVVNEVWYVEHSSLDLCEKPKVLDIVKSEGCGICGVSCGNGC